MNENRFSAYFFTALVETSPQALPLGAACVASAVKHDSLTKDFFSVFLYSVSLEEKDDSALIADEIVHVFPDIKSEKCAVCMSIYVWNKKILEETAGLLKKINSNIIFIAGGPEPTANPFGINNFDYSIVGQGEGSVPHLLNDIFVKKDSVSLSPGVYKLQDKEKFNTLISRSPVPNLERLTSPYLDGTLDPALYGGVLWELARGCPFKCTYCYESKGEKNISYFSKDRLNAEIDLFAKKNVSQVFVLDPTYNANKKRALEILRAIKKKLPSTFFYFEARAEFIDRELASAFSKIKCAVQFGLQSSDEAVLKNVNRSLNKKLFKKNIGFLNDEGVIFGFDLIYGLPGDTLLGFKKSIDFALSLYPNNLELFCLSILPGTKLSDDAPSFGIQWLKEPPYTVISTPKFSSADLKKARDLSRAADVFYNRGRAVPWFFSVTDCLKESPSSFLSGFESYLKAKNFFEKDLSDEDILDLQKDFVSHRFSAKGLNKYIPLVMDLISLNGALGMCTAEGKETTVLLNYHPDDLMSGYAADLKFFTANAGKQKNTSRVFLGENGPDWAVIK